MDISVLDFILSICLSFGFGVGVGLMVCCKYKDKFMSRSKSSDDLRKYNHQPIIPIVPSAPLPESVITIKR
jgi:hypothetical protein